ncbi:MAG: hypothetical protein ACPGRX_07080 [Bdellovibrionales bacterium]
MGNPKTIWAIPAIHAQLDRLTALHDDILSGIKPGDRVLYLGNYTGYGDDAAACVDEILTFRRMVLAMPGMAAKDLVYLRGMQEEMWQKLLQLQFAPNPSDVLLWMLGKGLSQTLYSYGLSPHDGIEACRNGIMGITKWTNTIRAAIRRHPGHDVFSTQHYRAAFTQEDAEAPLLFVHAGINACKPLSEQGDALWWDGQDFNSIATRYDPFHKVVRGYDPTRKGLNLNCVTATLDDGCGFGGGLACAQFARDGEVANIVTH